MPRGKRSNPAKEEPKGQSELVDLREQIAKVHGGGVLVPASEGLVSLSYLPFRIGLLDISLRGGLPESSQTLLYGWSASGKTTAAMRLMGSAQDKYPDKTCVFCDLEGTYNQEWAETQGVDHSEGKFLYLNPDTGESAVDIVNSLIEAKEVSLIVVDSLSAIVPHKVGDASAEDMHVGIEARLINLFLKKASQKIRTERKRGHKVSLVVINQFREKVGVVYGDTRTLPGGWGQTYYPSNLIEFRKVKDHMGRDENNIERIDYAEHVFKIQKTKAGVITHSGQFDLVRSHKNRLPVGSINEHSSIVRYAKTLGLITGGGTRWTVHGVDKKFGKLEEIVDWTIDNPDNLSYLRKEVIMSQRESDGLPRLPADGYLC